MNIHDVRDKRHTDDRHRQMRIIVGAGHNKKTCFSTSISAQRYQLNELSKDNGTVE